MRINGWAFPCAVGLYRDILRLDHSYFRSSSFRISEITFLPKNRGSSTEFFCRDYIIIYFCSRNAHGLSLFSSMGKIEGRALFYAPFTACCSSALIAFRSMYYNCQWNSCGLYNVTMYQCKEYWLTRNSQKDSVSDCAALPLYRPFSKGAKVGSWPNQY